MKCLAHPAPHAARSSALRAAASAAWLACCAATVHAEDCGSLESHYGPFDYRVDHSKRPIVESYHFSAKVESLAGGQNAVTPGRDLEYVLQTFPNHHRALVAAMKWARIKGTLKPGDFQYSIDCHFDRALRFRSDDVVVRMLLAQWLGQTKRTPDALRQLSVIDPKGNPQTMMNLGLVYAELGAFEEANARAAEAAAAGGDIGPLRAVLEKAGHWKPAATASPVTAPASASASAADAAAKP